MSKEAIQAVVHELESLPESDQRLVLDFLTTLKRSRHGTKEEIAARENNPALANKGGLLVFTGQVGAPDADWVRLDRDERHEKLM